MSAETKAVGKSEKLALAKLFSDKDVAAIRGGVVVAQGKKARTISIDCLVRVEGTLTVAADGEASVGPKVCPWRMIEYLVNNPEDGFAHAVKYSAECVNAHLKKKKKNPELEGDAESEAIKERAQAAADSYFKTIKIPRRGAVVFAGVVTGV